MKKSQEIWASRIEILMEESSCGLLTELSKIRMIKERINAFEKEK